MVKGRTQYSDEDKASAMTLLAVYNGNVKRAARNTHATNVHKGRMIE
jgi:transposase-like protein